MKEKVLAGLQDLILTVKNKGQELKEPHLFGLWSAKIFKVKEHLAILSDVDREWVDNQLKEWFKKEIESSLNDAQRKLLEEKFSS